MQPANTLVDLAAGTFSAAVAAIWSGDRLTEFLTATDRRRQVWYACLAAPFGNFSPERNDVDMLHARLTSWRAKNLIVQAYGCRPRGALGVIGRLGSRARDPEVYQLLMDVMERGGPGAKLLMHGAEPSDQLIETIAALVLTVVESRLRPFRLRYY